MAEKIVVSNKEELVKQDWVAIAKNVARFTMPVLAIFFSQLAMGVEFRAAALVALYAFYSLVSDVMKKWSSETRYPV